MKKLKFLLPAMLACSAMVASSANAERLKDISTVQGVRQNQLMGYGLVVGLDGSGDQTTQTPFTVQSVVSMLQQSGVSLPPGISLQLKNVAAVIVTSSLPSFAQPGQALDITVSSMGNAKSLRGGTLLMTPLKGADGQIYAMAQGNLLVAGPGSGVGGGKSQAAHLSVGRITAGATVEKAAPSALGSSGTINLELNESSFSTASKVTEAINKRYGVGTAVAQDGRVIKVKTPVGSDLRVTFLGELEDVEVFPSATSPKIILNARTGSVVMNQGVTLEPCAVSHGNLSVVINAEKSLALPAVSTDGRTVVVQSAQVQIQQSNGNVVHLGGGANLSEVVKALNAMGATPQDLLAILQAMKTSGALKAELEII